MDEFVKELEIALEDEDKGVEQYTKLARWCWENGYTGYSQILSDMASEELTHARHLKEIWEDIKHD